MREACSRLLGNVAVLDELESERADEELQRLVVVAHHERHESKALPGQAGLQQPDTGRRLLSLAVG